METLAAESKHKEMSVLHKQSVEGVKKSYLELNRLLQSKENIIVPDTDLYQLDPGSFDQENHPRNPVL
ncbi:MAG: hypothetical protein U5K51_08725 [Flavobacteriaceae bacterium]|nr:hypothetical protein [Flavobacteriaceae bacterium]